MSEKILVAGAGGYVGGKLVQHLSRNRASDIRAISSRPVSQWIFRGERPQVLNESMDLRDYRNCLSAMRGVKWVYNLAAKVGGIGYIQGNHAECLMSSLINTNLLRAAKEEGVSGFFYASSACVYGSSTAPAKETDPLVPSKGYGEEKVFSETMCRAFANDYGLPVRVGRYHAIYGPGDDIKGAENKDHVPAALCRKVLQAKMSGCHEIAIWGDGEQTRNFLFIDDAVEGARKLLGCGCDSSPVNIGSSETVTVNALVTMLEEISGVSLTRFYALNAPQGVRNRGCDNTRLRALTKWEPMTTLREGVERLYRDLYDQALRKA